jgi:protein EFR3
MYPYFLNSFVHFFFLKAQEKNICYFNLMLCVFNFLVQSTHLMISMLIKHLEHKAILKQPEMQLSIVQITATLAEQSRVQTSVQLITAITDLVRHLKRTLHFSLDSKDLSQEMIKWNEKFRVAVDECLIQLSKKVN